jgi:hypothetical protein
MKKLKVGDIFEIETQNGFGYFQCMDIDKSKGELIKVFNKLYEIIPEELINIISVNDFYYYRFPLLNAYLKKIVRFVGNINIDTNFQIPKYMREEHKIRGDFLGWHIVNTETLFRKLVKELSDDEKMLSEYGIINDSYLKEKLETGWSPKNWI